jgi:tRNA (guanine-N7-)-methyltransferase
MRLRRRKNLSARLDEVNSLLFDGSAGVKRPLIVELGCGMGRFACETAAARPDAFVIGVERAADAIIIGLERARREGLQNIRFIPGDVGELPSYLAPGVTDQLYIHFCDPWPHWKKARRRLISRNFLRMYEQLLAPADPAKTDAGGGSPSLHFKTDNASLFAFAEKELAAEGWIVTHRASDSPPGEIMTDYEIKFRALGIPIASLSCKPNK